MYSDLWMQGHEKKIILLGLICGNTIFLSDSQQIKEVINKSYHVLAFSRIFLCHPLVTLLCFVYFLLFLWPDFLFLPTLFSSNLKSTWRYKNYPYSQNFWLVILILSWKVYVSELLIFWNKSVNYWITKVWSNAKKLVERWTQSLNARNLENLSLQEWLRVTSRISTNLEKIGRMFS